MKHTLKTLQDLTQVKWAERTLVNIYYWTTNPENEYHGDTIEYDPSTDTFTIYYKNGASNILSEHDAKKFLHLQVFR